MNLTRILTPVAVAAAFAVAPLATQAQSLFAAQGADFQLADPSGSGRYTNLQFLGGYGLLDFNNGSDFQLSGDPYEVGGAVGFMTVAQLAATGTDGASITQTLRTDPYQEGGEFVADAMWASPSATGLTLDTSGTNAGQFGVINMAGGFGLQGARVNGILLGGQLVASNVRVDLVNQQVIADLSGTRSAFGSRPAAPFSAPGTALWTFDQVTGPTSIDPSALLSTDPVAALASGGLTVVQSGSTPIYQTTTCFSGGTGYGYGYGGGGGYYYPCTQQVGTANQIVARADLNLSGLTLTEAGAQMLSNSLGLQATGVDALNGANLDPDKWGSLRVGVFLRAGDLTPAGWPSLPASVPEPSTYALMGVGLLGIWGVSRSAARRRSAAV